MRWKQKPPGSNWGEFGPDDQRGRMNYVTREKVLQGIAEVKEGITFVFVNELPHTATGKLSKLTLRQQFKDYRLDPK